MSCEHAESTTLLWAYGEAAGAHEQHIARCVECQEVVDGIERVQAAIQPIAPALGVAEPLVGTSVNNGFRQGGWALGLALAAALLLAVGTLSPHMNPPPVPADTDLAVLDVAPSMGDALYGDLDVGLDDLEAELDSLAWDLNTL